MSERAGRNFDAGYRMADMAGERGAVSAIAVQIRNRKIAALRQRRVDDGRGMPFTYDKPIALRQPRLPRVDAHDPRIEYGENIGHRKTAADMGRSRLEDHAQG